jgi:hypothetical protein
LKLRANQKEQPNLPLETDVPKRSRTLLSVTIVTALIAALVVVFDPTKRAAPIESGTNGPGVAVSDAPKESARKAAAIAPTAFTGGENNDARADTSDHFQAADSGSTQSTVARIQPADVVSSPNSIVDALLESEPVDPDWAPRMESLMWSIVSTIGEVLELKCRTSACVAAVVPSSSDPREHFQNRVLNDTFQSIIGSSGGRLQGVRIGFFGVPDGRSGFTISLFGPPLESVEIDPP